MLKKQKNIRFSGAGDSHQNWTEKCAIKMIVTMKMTMFTNTSIRCPDDTFSTDFFPTETDYTVWI